MGPDQAETETKRREEMAYVITSKCAGCLDSACVDVCPCDCIVGPVPLDELRAVPAKDRGARFPGIQMFIHPDECVDCGACVPVCPEEAIYADADVPAEHAADIERNARFFEQVSRVVRGTSGR